jgi:hypothetical protein
MLIKVWVCLFFASTSSVPAIPVGDLGLKSDCVRVGEAYVADKPNIYSYKCIPVYKRIK